jgi:TRAP-type C4-dicarboxylate transport system permease small subunit
MPDPAEPPRGAVARVALGFALLGGFSLFFVAGLTTVSVLLRWLTNQPVRGDVEMISLGSGLAVMGFLAYGTLMRSNILVDSFSSWLPARVTHLIDGFWMLVWGVVVLFLARGMAIGAWEALHTHTTTIGLLGVPIWWVVAIGAACFLATAAAALYWVARFVRGRA